MADLNLLKTLADKDWEAHMLRNSEEPDLLETYSDISIKISELIKNITFDQYYKGKEEYTTNQMYENTLDIMLEILEFQRVLKNRNERRISTTFIKWHNKKMNQLEEKIEEYKRNQEDEDDWSNICRI